MKDRLKDELGLEIKKDPVEIQMNLLQVQVSDDTRTMTSTTDPFRDPRDGIIPGPEDYNAELAKKIDEISKIVIRPIKNLEDIQDAILPVYSFLMGYAKELVDPKNGPVISKENMIEIFDALNDSLLIRPLREEKEESSKSS